MADGPLIVQSDRTVLLEVAHPDAETRATSSRSSPSSSAHPSTSTPTGSPGWGSGTRAPRASADDMLATLDRWSRFPVPASVSIDIRETVNRYGRLVIERDAEGALVLRAPTRRSRRGGEEQAHPALLIGHPPRHVRDRRLGARAHQAGAAEDRLAGGGPRRLHPRHPARDRPARGRLDLRPYQRRPSTSSARAARVSSCSCGAGKTLVGAAAMAETKTTTLILVTNTVSARQWRDELLKRTTLTPEEIGEYSGQSKEVKPVTIATYQILTAKRKGPVRAPRAAGCAGLGPHRLRRGASAPAPVFKLTADLQARRRLGLTATLVREDGREGDVFSLIGPKRFDAPWKEIEAQGFISPAVCYEVRVDLPPSDRMEYAASADDERYRLAATAHAKIGVVKDLVARHAGEQILVIGQYLDQIDVLSEALDAPKITGATPVDEREELFAAFREARLPVLVVSKVANFSIDLPEASVAIQVSGSFGSRQEEAQRLGRLLRPKSNGHTASFYTLIARDTVDQDFAQNRQRFLAEQGYSYTILDAEGIAAA
jgi:DNA excision repair protein ERCC-3